MEDNNNKNMILAMVLSAVVLLGWYLIFPPTPPTEQSAQKNEITTAATSEVNSVPKVQALPMTRAEALTETKRIKIDSKRISGSITLTGALIDDISLKDYNVTLNDDSKKITILSPIQQDSGYWAFHAWWSPDGSVPLTGIPSAQTPWTIKSGDILSETSPITLSWDNGIGQVFEHKISIDDNYLITIKQSVKNNSSTTIQLAPYSALTRKGDPDIRGFYILHEGLISSINGKLHEKTYKKIRKFDEINGVNSTTYTAEEGGWTGFTDHYWMTSLLPEPGQKFESVTEYNEAANRYKSDIRLPAVTIAPKGQYTVTSSLFTGAKEYETIAHYQEENGFVQYIDAIDWGMFFFLTKPIFKVLHFLNGLIGNMGLAIIGLTLLIKAILFPLAYKSYVSMARMKDLQPEMAKLKEKHGDDRVSMQKDVMKMYKAKKVNPAAGCLPILLQIPIFFSLYKVIFVTIEMYHAPFFGWIHDLSAPDPSSILNLFGLLPWGTPEPSSMLAILSIGIFPILMGITMWLQQKLNPAPTDKTQAQIFAWMPWVFMFMLGRFAAGLVVYWVANNTITFIQQYTIMRSQGVKPNVLGNILGRFSKNKKIN